MYNGKAEVLFAVIIGLAVGLIAAILGLFFGNIILFDSIALPIIAGSLCSAFSHMVLQTGTRFGLMSYGAWNIVHADTAYQSKSKTILMCKR